MSKIRLGICTNPDKAYIVKKAGFDFYEPRFFDMYSATDDQIDEWAQMHEKIGIKAEAMNCMLIGDSHQVTGPAANHDVIREYLLKTVPRSAKMGCETVVFGSAWSRNMPEGFSDREFAYKQINEYLRMASDICADNNINIAIEPLAASVTNIVSFVSEGHYVHKLAERENVRLLLDFYAASCNFENVYAVLTGYADAMEHLHFSAVDRKYPRRDDVYGNDYTAFFNGVKDSKYNKRISIEAANIGDEYEDMLEAMAVFKQYLQG
jgi:sugar phosphate isomerase/epimerase